MLTPILKNPDLSWNFLATFSETFYLLAFVQEREEKSQVTKPTTGSQNPVFEVCKQGLILKYIREVTVEIVIPFKYF